MRKKAGSKLLLTRLLCVLYEPPINPDDELFDEASAAVSVFKGLELILGNKSKSSYVPKMLHLANDFLRAVKPSLETKESKQLAVGVSLLVDLSIDFLSSWKRY